MWSEFKAFIAKGNVMDLAVGIIIGGAFAVIVSSLVDDVIMPVVGVIFGGLDFSNYYYGFAGQEGMSLEAAKEAGAVFAYGNFITAVINFLILAFIIFLMVRYVNKLRAQFDTPEEPAPDAAPPADVQLLTEIRDLMARSGTPDATPAAPPIPRK